MIERIVRFLEAWGLIDLQCKFCGRAVAYDNERRHMLYFHGEYFR
jgi:hypothetical protein